MLLKIMGVILVITGCGSVGFGIAANHKKEENALRQLIRILDFTECEVRYKLTPLPELCKQIAQIFRQTPGRVFDVLAKELESQISPDTACCMAVALEKVKDVPKITKNLLNNIGQTLGRFDLEGQLQELASVRRECERNLQQLESNRESRLRSYQTLGLCAGAALAILFV